MTVQAPKKQNREIKGGNNDQQREALIDGLNRDLAGEYQAILMYIHYAAKLTGPYRRELRALFQEEIGDDFGHFQFLADKISGLRGEPTTTPREVPPSGQPSDMLEQARMLEEQAVADYGVRVRQAAAFGDFGLQSGLEDRVADKIRRKEAIEHMRSIAPPLTPVAGRTTVESGSG